MSSKAYEDTHQRISPHEASIDELKDLLIKPEKKQIQHILTRLDDPMLRAKEVSSLLPEAISLSLLNDNKIARIIHPIIDDTIKASVKNNPKAMADAIFPALGPGIRKAITSTIMGMIQSLNHVLNHSFSIQGLKWRIEAIRSGKEFAEVVLLHTLVYKVEQIFLIHRETGIVLNHVVAEDTIIQDPDLVSGMLTAIQDFVNDSFHSASDDDIETLRIGADRTVWIEKGEHAFIASVIRGTPPLNLRTRYRELIEEIHIKSGDSLVNFDGDPFPFSIFREQLNEGLQSQEKKIEKKTSPLIWCILMVVIFLAGFWAFGFYQNQKTWNQYLSTLKEQKGLIILSTSKNDGVYQISALKDPLEKDPLSLLPAQAEEQIKVAVQWKPFYSLEPEFVLQRAARVLKPPPTIQLKLEHATVIAEGKAPQEWIDFFMQTAPVLSGINGADSRLVVNSDKLKLDETILGLLKYKVYFLNNSAELVPGQEDKLEQILANIFTMLELGNKLKTPVKILIRGHSDSSGPETLNLRLSRNRSQKIFDYLSNKGIKSEYLNISGVATKFPLIKENNIDDRQYNRAVSFKIY